MKVKDFKGVQLQDLSSFEQCFSINVNIYHLSPEKMATVKYLSAGRYTSTVNCNMFGNHLSFIKNFKCYASKYQCDKCLKHFHTLKKHNRHAKTCTNKGTTFSYPGGYMKPPQNVFEQLEIENLTVPACVRYFDFYATFDFEAMLLPKQNTSQGDKTCVMHEHKPISVSTASNITLKECQHNSFLEHCNLCEKYKSPKCIIDDNLDNLMTKFVKRLSEMQEQSYAITKEKYASVFNKISARMSRLQMLLDSFNEEKKEKENIFAADDGNTDDEYSCTKAMEVECINDQSEQMFDRLRNLPNTYSKFLGKLCQEDRFSVEYNSFTTSSSDDTYTCDEVHEERSVLQSYKEYDENECKRTFKNLECLKERLETYCSQLPILGFNSSKYDLNLIKQKLASHLNLINEKDRFVVKKVCVHCKHKIHTKFLDITNFVAPGYSYEKFLKAYEATKRKGFFPYEYVTSVDQLHEVELVPMDAFYSSLKGRNVLEAEWIQYRSLADKYKSDERALKEMKLEQPPPTADDNYRYLQQVWQEHNMENMHDFLTWYNNLDVGPFVEAVHCMLHFYREEGIDLFKDSLSIPGVSRKILFSQAAKEGYHFSLFDKNHKHIYELFRKHLTGGPSILFHRHAEVDETFIRGNPKKKCKRIYGHDCNSLYRYVYRDKTDGFFPHIRDKYDSQYDWLEWLSHSKKINIKHGHNGGEHRVGPYFLDGYHAATRTAYEYQGCWWHGAHGGSGCFLMTKHKNSDLMKQRWERKLRRRQFIEKKGYQFIEIWECEWITLKREEPDIQKFLEARNHSIFKQTQPTTEQLMDAVISENLFGALEVDIRVPSQWLDIVRNRPDFVKRFAQHSPYEYFSEMSPLFCST